MTMGLFTLRWLLLGVALVLEAVCSVQGMSLEATAVYDTQGACVEMSVAPVRVMAAPSDDCVESANCVETPEGTSLFPATVCSITDGTGDSEFITTTLPYLFGANPYVVVELYESGQSCDPTMLTGITTYLADGMCHKTDTESSYRATRKADGSATVQQYSDATCTTAGMLLTVTATQATKNTCDGTVNGIADTKVFGAGSTPLYLTSTVNYDSNANSCKSGLPSYVSTTVVAVDTCVASTACIGGSAPYTGTSCSSTLTYQADMTTAFGSNPYVIVEKYNAGKSCNPEELASITTYRADTICHQTSSTASYRVTRSDSDLSAIIQVFTDSPSCTTTGKVLP